MRLTHGCYALSLLEKPGCGHYIMCMRDFPRAFAYLTSEDFIFGLFPLFGFSLRWKSAEDGITPIIPTFTRIRYS
jgi:hypothetical protein